MKKYCIFIFLVLIKLTNTVSQTTVYMRDIPFKFGPIDFVSQSEKHKDIFYAPVSGHVIKFDTRGEMIKWYNDVLSKMGSMFFDQSKQELYISHWQTSDTIFFSKYNEFDSLLEQSFIKGSYPQIPQYDHSLTSTYTVSDGVLYTYNNNGLSKYKISDPTRLSIVCIDEIGKIVYCRTEKGEIFKKELQKNGKPELLFMDTFNMYNLFSFRENNKFTLLASSHRQLILLDEEGNPDILEEFVDRVDIGKIDSNHFVITRNDSFALLNPFNLKETKWKKIKFDVSTSEGIPELIRQKMDGEGSLTVLNIKKNKVEKELTLDYCPTSLRLYKNSTPVFSTVDGQIVYYDLTTNQEEKYKISNHIISDFLILTNKYNLMIGNDCIEFRKDIRKKAYGFKNLDCSYITHEFEPVVNDKSNVFTFSTIGFPQLQSGHWFVNISIATNDHALDFFHGPRILGAYFIRGPRNLGYFLIIKNYYVTGKTELSEFNNSNINSGWNIPISSKYLNAFLPKKFTIPRSYENKILFATQDGELEIWKLDKMDTVISPFLTKRCFYSGITHMITFPKDNRVLLATKDSIAFYYPKTNTLTYLNFVQSKGYFINRLAIDKKQKSIYIASGTVPMRDPQKSNHLFVDYNYFNTKPLKKCFFVGKNASNELFFSDGETWLIGEKITEH